MRGESRRCKGSIEPLLKLPDGALATRRIVFFFLDRCCGGCAAAAAARRRRAAQKACSSAKLCRLTQRRTGVFLFVSRRERVTQK